MTEQLQTFNSLLNLYYIAYITLTYILPPQCENRSHSEKLDGCQSHFSFFLFIFPKPFTLALVSQQDSLGCISYSTLISNLQFQNTVTGNVCRAELDTKFPLAFSACQVCNSTPVYTSSCASYLPHSLSISQPTAKPCVAFPKISLSANCQTLNTK